MPRTDPPGRRRGAGPGAARDSREGGRRRGQERGRGGAAARRSAPADPDAATAEAAGFGAAFAASSRGRGRRVPLSVDAIVTAAVRILDEEGTDALTFRRLAQDLEVGVASLYWHVESKDVLLELALDRVLGEVDTDPAHLAKPWQTALRDCALGMRDVYLAHRWAATQTMLSEDRGPNLLRMWEFVGQILTGAGFTIEQAFNGLSLIAGHVIASGAQEDLSGEITGSAERRQRMNAMGEFLASLEPKEFPTLVASAGLIANHDQLEQFTDSLDLIIGGLDRLRTAD